jgi:hypothetical protein
LQKARKRIESGIKQVGNIFDFPFSHGVSDNIPINFDQDVYFLLLMKKMVENIIAEHEVARGIVK